jgi:hypothetical protein
MVCVPPVVFLPHSFGKMGRKSVFVTICPKDTGGMSCTRAAQIRLPLARGNKISRASVDDRKWKKLSITCQSLSMIEIKTNGYWMTTHAAGCGRVQRSVLNAAARGVLSLKKQAYHPIHKRFQVVWVQ